jgi:butyryl-CoA dehydrogenase
MEGGAGLKALALRMQDTAEAAGHHAELAEHANALAGALQRLGAATKSAWATGVPEEALSNATPYLQAFGHVVLAWLWLDVARAAMATAGPALPGRLAALRYFYAYELPRIDAWLGVVARREAVCRDMQPDWF